MKKIIGFTLIELLTSLAVLAVLLLIGIPISQALFERNHVEVIDNEIKNAIRYARNMALVKGVPLTLNPLNDEWSKGMILFVDNKSHQYSEKDTLVHQWQWHHPGISVTWQGFRSDNYLIFSPTLRHSTLSGHFLIFNKHLEQKKLVVNRIGRVS